MTCFRCKDKGRFWKEYKRAGNRSAQVMTACDVCQFKGGVQMMRRYKIKGGPAFTGMPASFIGIIRATHVHELNGREMVNMEMATPEGRKVFGTCWLYFDDIEEVTDE